MYIYIHKSYRYQKLLTSGQNAHCLLASQPGTPCVYCLQFVKAPANISGLATLIYLQIKLTPVPNINTYKRRALLH